MKICNICKKELPLEEFVKDKNKKDGLHSRCKECTRKYYQDNKEKIKADSRKWKGNNKEKQKEISLKYCLKNKKSIAKKQKAANQKHKAEIMAVYGGKCVCCGETILDFLSMDHIQRDWVPGLKGYSF